MLNLKFIRKLIVMNIIIFAVVPVVFGRHVVPGMELSFYLSPLNWWRIWMSLRVVAIILGGLQVILVISSAFNNGENNKTNRNVSRFATPKEINTYFRKIKDKELAVQNDISVTDFDTGGPK